MYACIRDQFSEYFPETENYENIYFVSLGRRDGLVFLEFLVLPLVVVVYFWLSIMSNLDMRESKFLSDPFLRLDATLVLLQGMLTVDRRELTE